MARHPSRDQGWFLNDGLPDKFPVGVEAVESLTSLVQNKMIEGLEQLHQKVLIQQASA